ncbi:peptidase S41 [Altericroceibacterium spongiae]|uniref:Peptidase S41 n=1 Tax=Altericroceibacterium spongiae TaxID=2320269 RepID=A0A420EPB0_9SPHN|nr:PDZ domain-containing protein [Altericroceibacterium spongiae]RKF22513.1 peptidase S41 [Altericroceibacterium spongiae]
MRLGIRRCVLIMCAALSLGAAAEENRYAIAARALDDTIRTEYAYPDKLPGGVLPQSPELSRQRLAVHDRTSLLHYAENRMASLADHHAITGSSFADSWAIIPTYTDLWIIQADDGFLVDAVRENSVAAKAGIEKGQRLVAVNGVPADQAVKAFWDELGLEVTPRRAAYAARVLAAGRRDRDRHLTIADRAGTLRQVVLPSLYGQQVSQVPLSVSSDGSHTVIRFNNSLGDERTIAAFDEAMRRVPSQNDLVLDLRDTPSGGNTTIARAIMGWFVSKAQNYQIHNRPAEKRETGIARQWVEQVLPREGRHRDRLPVIRVGRWTGSMGEGLAVGFAAMGASVQGAPMAGLNGAVEDLPVGDTGLTVKLPTERLMTVFGQPREDFVPEPLS